MLVVVTWMVLVLVLVVVTTYFRAKAAQSRLSLDTKNREKVDTREGERARTCIPACAVYSHSAHPIDALHAA